MDIEIAGEPAGRLEMVLYDSIVPKTVANFESLCRNKCKPIEDSEKGKVRNKGFAKDKAKFFRVVPGGIAQCGMQPLSGNAAHVSTREYES